MPRNPERDSRELAHRKQNIVEAAFRLFTRKTIDAVSMREIASASGMSESSLYRHYATKPELVVAVATWVWDEFMIENRRQRDSSKTTAAEDYEFFLDSFLKLYRSHIGLLRFNQFFNVYVMSAQISMEQMRSYQDMMNALREWFYSICAKSEKDGTLLIAAPEAEEAFSRSLHLMLAAVTRYAVGLIYNSGDPEEELVFLKSMLMRQYVK